MSKGKFLSFYGIGGGLFSDGMDDLTMLAKGEGWDARTFRNYGNDALDFVKGHKGPIVVAGHSQGASDNNNFAAFHGGTVDAAIFVDSWFAFDAAPNIKYVVSVRATRGGRFHVTGANVKERFDLNETHTTVDNSNELKEITRKLLREVSSKSYGVATTKVEPVTKPFYIGEGRQITEREVAEIAGAHGIPAYLALAATSVETPNLEGSWSSGALVALYEDHVAWRNTAGEIRKLLSEAGLAAPNWKDLPYPASPYPAIDRCAAIAGAEVAAKATSWGMYQILGENAVALGYKSAVDMVETFAASERAQVEGWIRFLDKNDLKGPLLREDFVAYARGYNGPKFAENRYDQKLRERAAEFKAKYGAGLVTSNAVVPADPGEVPAPTGGAIDLTGHSVSDMLVLLQKLNEAQAAVLAEIQARGETPVAPTTIANPTTTEGTFQMGKISKLIGGLVGLLVGSLVTKGVLPPEAGEIVTKVTTFGLTPELIIQMLTVGAGIYFSPKNAA